MKLQVLVLSLMTTMGACKADLVQEEMSTASSAITARQMKVRWHTRVMYEGDRGQYTTSGELFTDADYDQWVEAAFKVRDQVCQAFGGPTCIQTARIGFTPWLCRPDTPCNGSLEVPEVIGLTLLSRYDLAHRELLDYLKRRNFPIQHYQETLQFIQETQDVLRFALQAEIADKPNVTQIANSAHDRLADMGATAHGEDQVRLADTRRTVDALTAVTDRYQADLDVVQATYGDVAARHASYRGTEAMVFAGITQLAREASSSDLNALASLKVRLGAESNRENRDPQLLIMDAKRIEAELTSIQAAYEAGLAPHKAYLTEHALPVLDHASAPKEGMVNVVTYAENRMRRVNDAVRAIYDGIRRREAALSLAAADAATRDQLRAADAALREADFLADITNRSSEIWKTPPASALNLPLQGERVTAMTSFLQLEKLCKDVTASATWRAPGCQKVAADASKVRTYLSQTLPFTLRFGVQKMRSAGFDPIVLADIEAKVAAGELAQAVYIYDATLRAAENS